MWCWSQQNIDFSAKQAKTCDLDLWISISMAATMLNALCCFLFFTMSFNHCCFRTLGRSPQDRWNDMLFHPSRVCYLLTGFYGSSLVTARVKLQSRIGQPYRLRFAIYKWSKHGQTCLSIPDCDHAFDLTIFMDIHRNPGPNYTASNPQEFEFRVNNRNEANLHASTRSSICYSSEQLLNIRRVWSTYLTVTSRNHLLF